MVEQTGMNPRRRPGWAGRIVLMAAVLSLAAGCSKRPGGGADEQVEPGLHILPAEAREFEDAITFTLLLEPARSNDVVVDFTTSPAPPAPDPALATPGQDFVARSGQVTIKAGQTRASLSIELNDDEIYERTETFAVLLTSAAGAEISTAQATGTILDNDPRPVASLRFTGDTTIPEGFGEKRSFTIELDRPSSLDSVLLIRHEANGVNPQAQPRMDYVLSQDGSRLAKTATLTIAAGETRLAAPVELEVVDDGQPEGDEDTVLSLFGLIPQGQTQADVDIHATDGSITLTISDNDAAALGNTVAQRPLNDTGVTARYENGSDSFPGQDADQGSNLLSFTKLDAAGNPLPDDATSWDCVKDNVTGLVWEVKQGGTGLRGAERKFRWYDPDDTRNGGVAGIEGSEVCDDSSLLPSTDCNMQYYAADMNLIGLCGRTGWRVPTLEELRGLGNYASTATAIDPNYFPNDPTVDSASAVLWTAQTVASRPGMAWVMRFDGLLPVDGLSSKTDQAGVEGRAHLRLVTEDSGS